MNSNLGNQFSSVLNDQQKSAIQSYTWIGDKSKWKDIASDLAKGNKPKAEKDEVQTVKTLLNTVQTNSSPAPVGLRSGVNFPKGKGIPKIGDTVEHHLLSATTKSQIAEDFSKRGQGKPVIYHYPSGIPAFDIKGHGSFGDEGEHIISGVFKVQNRYNSDGITHVGLELKE